MQIQPKQPTVENPAEQFTGAVDAIASAKKADQTRHVTDEEYSA